MVSPRTSPTDAVLIQPPDDVFRARLKTVGVCEYNFEMEAGFESGTEWRIIDVGGSRSQVSEQLLLPGDHPLTVCVRRDVSSIVDASYRFAQFGVCCMHYSEMGTVFRRW